MRSGLMLPKALENLAFMLGNLEVMRTRLRSMSAEFWLCGYDNIQEDQIRIHQMSDLLKAASISNDASTIFDALAAFEDPFQSILNRIKIYESMAEEKRLKHIEEKGPKLMN